MNPLMAALLGAIGLCAAWFVYLAMRAPKDTDVWPGGEPRPLDEDGFEGRGIRVNPGREPW